MAIVNTTIRTATCNTCNKTASFEYHQGGVSPQVLVENPWLKPGRTILTTDGRQFFYCSDECEVKNAATGVHNPPVEKAIIDAPANQAAIEAAAANAKAIENANKAIRSGSGGPITLS